LWSHGHVDFIFGAQQLEIVKVLLCLFQFNLLLEGLLEVLCHDSILDKYNDFRLDAFGGIIIEDFYQLLDFLRYSSRLLDLFLQLYLIKESELFQDLASINCLFGVGGHILKKLLFDIVDEAHECIGT